MTLPYLTPLDADTQRAHGIAAPWPLAIADRVRFSELDPLNHVNNAAYLSWFEGIRIHYFRDWDISHYRPGDPRLVIRRAEVDYLREMRLDEDYILTARTVSFRTTSFTMEYALWAGDLRATGAAVVVMLAPDGSGKMPLPDALRQRFEQVDGARAA
ncbi:thioesterase family protein [Actibacterium sp. MT2.3-13A]|uniref:acyl-CoA thioesterase n=1 Tax=Actibacterium sp. MT2.3-13A TaxID=2828332 RepID=UPI001BA84538|nr:thioesterase family protein [Actibacterium sp. MT2.3-13A]